LFYGGGSAVIELRPNPAQLDPNSCPDFTETFDYVIRNDWATFQEIPYGPMVPNSDPCNAGNIFTFSAFSIGFPPVFAYDAGYATFS
jgi:hypothetical protein